MFKHTAIAWLLLALAILSWALVGFFVWTISTDEAERVANVDNAAVSFAAGASALRTHALARDVAPSGAQLKEFLNADIVSVAYMIEGAAKAAGIKAKLGDALPENAPEGTVPLRAVGFVVEGQGTFAQVMLAAKLFETLPVASSVTRLNIERVPATAGGKGATAWHINAYIRVVTTSDISS